MVSKKEHRQRSGCPVACALDLIGDHWSLLIIRDLMFLNRHEYKDMLNSEEGISSNILSDRLKKLESAELISSFPHPESGRRKLYYLTSRGKDLIHIMIDIVLWSEKHLGSIVNIPADKKEVLLRDPELMITDTLKELAEWENAYGVML
jgi:DNA-binding HxlR family transcriptional regulator